MRISEESIVVALTGPSASGKTTIARELAQIFGVQARHCGDVVRQRARSLEVALFELPLAEHRAIDAETLGIVRLNSGLFVVEGTFLEEVLAGQGDILRWHLTCDWRERVRRFAERGSVGAGAEEALRERDAADAAVRVQLYGETVARDEWVEFDTGGVNPSECAERLAVEIRQRS